MNAYEIALLRRTEIIAEIEKIDQFLVLYDELLGSETPVPRKYGDPRSVALKIVESMKIKGYPMGPLEISEEIAPFIARSKNKRRYVAAILARNKDLFSRTEYGWVLKAPAECQIEERQRRDTAAHLVRPLPDTNNSSRRVS